MSTTPVKAILLPAGINVRPQEVLYTDYLDIQQYVGGHFDAVRVNARSAYNDNVTLVGYVHDEGMLIGLEDNWLAMAIFRQPLVGDCLIVSGTNPTTGEYDGESYDVPEELCDYITGPMVDTVAEAHNQTMVVSEALDWAELSGALSDEDLDFLSKELFRLHEEEQGLQHMDPQAVQVINRALMELKSFIDDTETDEEE
jgi:hypothetical protein